MTKTLNIILADDDKDDCFLFSEAIEELSLSIALTTVHDGDKLMQLLENEVSELPHAIFLDLNMPRKNGFECLNEIMQTKKLSSIPVIIFSTSFNHEMANRLYQHGAYYYMRKPSDFPKLKNAIHHALTNITETAISPPAREDFVIVK